METELFWAQPKRRFDSQWDAKLAMQLVLADAAPAQCLLDEGDALRDERAVPPGAVLLGERHELPARAGAAVRHVSSSISASRPVTSASSGGAAFSMRVSRIASAARSARVTASPDVAAQP